MDISTDLLREHKLMVRTITMDGELMERCICGIIYADAVVNYLKEGE
jgi:hypothetical protein